MTRPREYYTAIVEREFRKALNLTPDDIVHVELGDEEINIGHGGRLLTCDCDNDENFVFVDLFENSEPVIFPIPADYLLT